MDLTPQQQAALRTRVRQIAAGILFAILFFAGWIVQQVDSDIEQQNAAEPVHVFEAPLRATFGGVDQILLLTGRWERIRVRNFRWSLYKRGVKTYLHVDLWAMDAGSLKPLWRRRLATIENGARTGKSLLGADGNTVWLFVDGPLAISAVDGRELADGPVLEARNPALAGQLLKEERHYGFDAAGFWATSADARRWRIDAALKASPLAGQETARASAVLPVVTGPGTAIQYSQLRGMKIGTRWLGVLSDEEAAKLVAMQNAQTPIQRAELTAHLSSMITRGGLPAHANVRNRLWQATLKPGAPAAPDWLAALPQWDTLDTYGELAPLPEGPEFLNGGLLTVNSADLPLFLRNPDSVLVLHQQRIGETGQLQLSRIVGPGGRVVWDALLPLTQIYSVLPGERTLVLHGGFYRPTGKAFEKRDNDAATHLVAIDLASGKVSAFDFSGEGREHPIVGSD